MASNPGQSGASTTEDDDDMDYEPATEEESDDANDNAFFQRLLEAAEADEFEIEEDNDEEIGEGE
jgi:hypothetical protein